MTYTLFSGQRRDHRNLYQWRRGPSGGLWYKLIAVFVSRSWVKARYPKWGWESCLESNIPEYHKKISEEEAAMILMEIE